MSDTALRAILPPHLLNALAQNSGADMQSLARHTHLLSERLRGRRSALALYYVSSPGGERCIHVYDAKHGREHDLPGSLIKNPKTSTDLMAKEAYAGALATYEMYAKEYGRNSIDDRGMSIDSSIHFSQHYDNAFWDGKQMVYGDGDGKYFNRFTCAIDVIGHELTHGVTEYEAALEYRGQAGALNESFSDVFGSLLKQRTLKQTADTADWLIGAGLFTKKVSGVALRSMKNPGSAYDDPVLGKDPQPGHMQEFHRLPEHEDSGGVHINSGIPNHAFYLAATMIGGFAWKKAGLIWYTALRDLLRPKSDFKDAAHKTMQAAGMLFKPGGSEQKAVQAAWHEVGVI